MWAADACRNDNGLVNQSLLDMVNWSKLMGGHNKSNTKFEVFTFIVMKIHMAI